MRLKAKIGAIAETLGKVDKNGLVTEDFEIQILGFLQTELNFEKLYRNALKDRTLKRTEQELDVALKKALSAREVVSNLFQDLDGFNLEDYQICSDGGKNMIRLVEFIKGQAELSGYQYKVNADGLSELKKKDTGEITLFTQDRNKALDNGSLQLFGLEHPIIEKMFQDATGLPLLDRAVICESDQKGIIVIWKVILSSNNKNNTFVVKVGISESGETDSSLTKKISLAPAKKEVKTHVISPALVISARNALMHELEGKRLLSEGVSCNAEPIALLCLL